MHEYVIRLNLASEWLPSVGVFHAEVRHDKECEIYSGQWCNCDCEITIYSAGESYSVQRDGTVTRITK